MLSSMLKEHQNRQAVIKERQETKRKMALAAANELTQALVDHLNVGVAQAYLNQKKLDLEAKQLHQSALQFTKQTQQWLSLIDAFNGALKEIGDLDNWARSIDSDLKTIATALDYAYKCCTRTGVNLNTNSSSSIIETTGSEEASSSSTAFPVTPPQESV